jgi:hypothetical protein
MPSYISSLTSLTDTEANEDIATVKTNHHRHLDKSPIAASVSIAHLQTIARAAA